MLIHQSWSLNDQCSWEAHGQDALEPMGRVNTGPLALIDMCGLLHASAAILISVDMYKWSMEESFVQGNLARLVFTRSTKFVCRVAWSARCWAELQAAGILL